MSCQSNECRRNNNYGYDDYNEYNNYDEYSGYNGCSYEDDPRHVHEYSSSVKLAEECEERHNHRAAGVTGEPIFVNGNHYHNIKHDNVDSFDHHHEINTRTSLAIPVPGTDKHIHLVCGATTVEDEHCHEFLFTTQIESPLI